MPESLNELLWIIFIGASAWWATHLIGSPWLKLKQLQGDVLEVVLFAANTPTPPPPASDLVFGERDKRYTMPP